MCWEQSPLKRTIATSRGDDNRDESEKHLRQRPTDHQDQANRAGGPNKRRPCKALPLRKKPRRDRFSLTDSFRNGLIDRWTQLHSGPGALRVTASNDHGPLHEARGSSCTEATCRESYRSNITSDYRSHKALLC